jgi:hypothetical protein
MESADPVRRERFGLSEWPCDGGGTSVENILEIKASDRELDCSFCS